MITDLGMSKKTVSEETKRKLSEMFLAELHQAWWAERLAQLRCERNEASDPNEVRMLDARIQEHYKFRHNFGSSRKRLGLIPPPPAR